jgi:hypothetical protein
MYPALWVLFLAFGLLGGGMIALSAEGEEAGPRPLPLLLIGLGVITFVVYWSVVLSGV